MTALKSNLEWKQWGKDDPLWGVASWSHKEKNGASPWTEDEFYSLGESDWRDFLFHWQHHGLTGESCLEIGCGAGRLTKPLAKFFDKVYAVDVSEDMIRVALNNVKNNVEFSVIDGLHLPQKDFSVKAVFSTHVLQHLDNVEIGYSYFREFYRVLDSGGTIMVHLPLYQFPAETGRVAVVMRMVYGFYRRLDDLRAYRRRQKGIKIMRGTPYPLRSLAAFLSEVGFKDIEFRIFPTKINNDLHSFVFATK
jgi:ubiquinone/menaquinone biosynthesis C-methylase UbiE